MILLGLDASSSSTGWAVFDNKGLSAYGMRRLERKIGTPRKQIKRNYGKVPS